MPGPTSAQRVATVPDQSPERAPAADAHAHGLTVGNAARARLGDAAALLDAPLGNAATAALLSRLDRRPHSALDPAVRGPFADAFGTPLADVAVHTDPEAAELAGRLDAQAVTVGRHVVFGAGRYAPGTAVGRALLGHELAHVVAQRVGGSGPGGAAAEHDADRAGSLAAAGLPARVAPAAPALARKPANQPVTVVVRTYAFIRPDGTTVKLPEADYQAERAKATASLRGHLRLIVDEAGTWRQTHQEFLNEFHPESVMDALRHPMKIVGAAVNMRAGVVPPYIGMWHNVVKATEVAEGSLQAGDLDRGARQTQRAMQQLAEAKREWNTFLDKSISGAETLQGELEVVRDVSFAIAIAAAAVVAAPVVASAIGVAGVGGMLLTAAGTGLVTGGLGLGLRTSADVVGQAVSGDEVEVGKAVRKNLRHLPGDIATGLTAGLAPGAGHIVGLGRTGLSTGGTIIRHAAAQGGVAAASGFVETGVDTARAMAVEGRTWEQAKKETVLPGLKRTAVNVAGAVVSAPLGVAGGKFAQAGRRALGGAVTHGGGAVVAGGSVLATGGTTREAAVATGQALITSTALAGATPQRRTPPGGPPGTPEPPTPATKAPVEVEAEPATPARPVEAEPSAPAVAPVTEPEPTAPRPVHVDELPAGRVANDTDLPDVPAQAAHPVEAAELGGGVVVPTAGSSGTEPPAPQPAPQPVAAAPQRPTPPPVAERRTWVHPENADHGRFKPLPQDAPAEHGRGSGRSEGETLTVYADAMRSRARKNRATAAVGGGDGPYIRDNLYSGKAQTNAVTRLAEHGIVAVSPDGRSIRVTNPDQYVRWLERAYRQHGQAILDPRMRDAIARYVGRGESLGTFGTDPRTGASSFGGALPGTHAEVLAINDLLAHGGAPDPAHVATVRAQSGAHFVACVHCTGIIAQLPLEVRAIVWTGTTTPAP